MAFPTCNPRDFSRPRVASGSRSVKIAGDKRWMAIVTASLSWFICPSEDWFLRHVEYLEIDRVGFGGHKSKAMRAHGNVPYEGTPAIEAYASTGQVLRLLRIRNSSLVEEPPHGSESRLGAMDAEYEVGQKKLTQGRDTECRVAMGSSRAFCTGTARGPPRSSTRRRSRSCQRDSAGHCRRSCKAEECPVG